MFGVAGFSVLFLIPIYYLAKSKGYNGMGWCIATLLLGLGSSYLLWHIFALLIFVFSTYALAVLVLFVLWMLPARKGAPGKAYLKITFTCPECKNSVTFGREEEGQVTICPVCKEIITVPEDLFSPKKAQRNTTCPVPVDGKVCFETYASQMQAEEVVTTLIGNDIQAFVLSPVGGGVSPIIGLNQGYSVIINVEDWAKAIAMEKSADHVSNEDCRQNTPPVPL